MLLAASIFPLPAFALSIPQALGFLDIFIGIFLTVSIILFGAGLIIYAVRYGTVHREEAFHYMQPAIAILFVLFVLMALVHYFQRHPGAFINIAGLILFILLVWLIIYIVSLDKKKKEKGPNNPGG